MRRITQALVMAGLLGALGLSGCYATSASVGVGVEAGVPASAPYYNGYYNDGYAWVDGHWAWTAYGWQWYPGYWVAARPGYVYLQGYWDFGGGSWVYRPGSWVRWRNGYAWVGNRWQRYWPLYSHYDYRRGAWVRRGAGGYYGVPVRDHRTGVPTRDHRSYRDGPPPIMRERPERAPIRRSSSGRHSGSGTYRARD